MAARCVSGKKMYATKILAEDVLIETWSRNEFVQGQGPVTVYQCEDCGEYHLTSRGPMNERLSEAIASGKISKQREGFRWEEKWKRK